MKDFLDKLVYFLIVIGAIIGQVIIYIIIDMVDFRRFLERYAASDKSFMRSVRF